MTERAYFDWNATAPLRDGARAAMGAALELTGNASSVHAEGRAARRMVEEAREKVADLVGAEAKNVTFTSGATEANMLALTPALEVAGVKHSRDRLFVSAIEHPSVRSGGRFAADAIEELPVTTRRYCSIFMLLAAPLLGPSVRLVSVMLANNETGVIQPIAEIAQIVHAANGLSARRCGAGGRAASIATSTTLGADLLTLSAHKLGGPQGAGALIRRGDIHIAEPLIKGGGQERGAARRHRECRGDCRLRRGRGWWQHQPDAARMAAVARPTGSGPEGSDAAGGDFRRRAARVCRIRLCSRFPASRRRPRLSRSISMA